MHATPDERARADRLVFAFEEVYGDAPTHFARAPGRVNLIGEHIDYAGLPVLPMAIQRRVTIAFRPTRTPEVRLASSSPGFESRAFRLDRVIEPYAAGDWGNYAKAAAVGLLNAGMSLSGVEALVDSDLPVAAGLSSSSALVIGFALALSAAAGESVPPLQLARNMAGAERFTGTRGGGMDQAICLGARAGCASVIDFDPLEIEHLPVPENWRFVVAFSLQEARKSGEAQTAYNLRRRQVEAALVTVREVLGTPDATYRRLLEDHSLDALLKAADRVLGRHLAQRFRHVVVEAGRVRIAADAMRIADVDVFGAAMVSSHRSLRENFEVSTPELDQLVGICLAAGAAGARLTGAGLGGSVIALARAENAAAVVDALRERFYDARLRSEPTAAQYTHEEVLFVAAPSAGATVEAL